MRLEAKFTEINKLSDDLCEFVMRWYKTEKEKGLSIVDAHAIIRSAAMSALCEVGNRIDCTGPYLPK